MTEQKKKRAPLQKQWCEYLIVNIVLLFPVCLFMRFNDLVYALFSWMPDVLSGAIFLPFVMMAVLYGIFLLPWVHIAVEGGFLVFAVYKLWKERNAKLFFITLGLTGTSVLLNVYWGLRYDLLMGV